MIEVSKWQELDTALTNLVQRYGAWAVLYRMADPLKLAFRLMEKEEADKKTKRPRRKKPPPRICGDCNGTGYHAEDGDSDCPECGGTGYLTATEYDQ